MADKYYFVIADDGYFTEYFVAKQTSLTDAGTSDEPLEIEFTQSREDILVMSNKQYMERIVERINNDKELGLNATLETIKL